MCAPLPRDPIRHYFFHTGPFSLLGMMPLTVFLSFQVLGKAERQARSSSPDMLVTFTDGPPGTHKHPTFFHDRVTKYKLAEICSYSITTGYSRCSLFKF